MSEWRCPAWTSAPPIVEGWYWWRESFDSAPRPGHVHDYKGDLFVEMMYEGKIEPVASRGGQWSGPLIPPA